MKKYIYLLGLLFANLFVLAQDGWTVLSTDYPNVTLRDVYADGNTIIAVGSDIGTFTPVIVSSFDGGETWDSTQAAAGALLRSIAFSNSNIGLIGSVNTASCVLRTEDKGKTWNWHYCDLDSLFTGINQFSFIDDKIGYMAGWGKSSFYDGAVYKTLDGGRTWAHVSGNIVDKPFEYLQFLDEMNGYGGSFLFGHSNLYKTSDGGKTWDTLNVSHLSFGNVDFQSVKEGTMVCSDGSIRKTIDGGNTWKLVVKKPGVLFASVEHLNGKIAYAVGNDRSLVSKVYVTKDSGNTWNEEAKGISLAPLDKVRFFDGRAYVVGGGGLIMRTEVIDPTGSITKKSKLANELKIYPNPSEGIVNIKLNRDMTFPMEFSILDAHGKIASHYIQDEYSSEFSLETNLLSSGVYTVQAKSSQNVVWRGKLLVK